MDLETVNKIKELISQLDKEIYDYIKTEPKDVEEVCSFLAEVNFLKRDLSMVYDSFAYAVPRFMGDTEIVELPSGAKVEKKVAYDRKGWEHEKLGSAVADKLVRLSIDIDTGEVVASPREIAAEMLKYCAPSYWRVKELKKIGIDADNYCTVGDLRTTIVVRKGNSE